MLCGNHFDDSSFTSSAKTRLNKFAIPTEAQNILAQLRHDHQLKEVQETQCQTTTMQMDMEATPSTSQCSKPTEHVTEFNLQSPDLTKESSKGKGVLKDLDVERIKELTPRKQKLYKKCRRNLTEILRLRRKLKNIKMCKRDVLSSLHNSDATAIKTMLPKAELKKSQVMR
ncbi:uncharacterized protein LOC123664292 [Melitaea cinxia]|nr:uncharacterized protein LOC123664292 [Melitaea cinxia]